MRGRANETANVKVGENEKEESENDREDAIAA